jgi:sporulation protein YlmC with PRC-barrel domain
MTTGSTIRSDEVSGTDVYGAGEEKVGQIDHLVIDKKSGRVVYAVMSFGGFMGFGGNYYAVPWNALPYDTHLDGFRTGITEKDLENAPAYDQNRPFDRDWETRIHDHYAVPYYW